MTYGTTPSGQRKVSPSRMTVACAFIGPLMGAPHAAGSNERARGLGRGGDIPCAPERDVALPDGDAVMDLVTHLHRLARPIEHKALPQLAARRVAFHPNPRNWRDGVTSR
jgi:hypothetical protein